MVIRRLAPKITQLRLRIPYVAGEAAGSSFPIDRLAAAIEKVMLAPH
jgi:hypothetical protein